MLKFISISLIFGLTCWASLVSAQSPLPAEWSLKDAVDKAMRDYPDTQRAREKLNESDAAIKSRIGLAFPSVSASVSSYRKKDALNGRQPLFGGDFYSLYSGEIDVVQPIYYGGAVAAGLSQSKISKELNEIELQKAERTLKSQIVDKFFGLLLAQRTLETNLQVEAVQKELLATADQRYRVGLEQLLPVLQFRTQLALIAPQIAQARSNLELTAAQFSSLLQLPGGTTVRVKGNLNPPEWESLRKQLEVGTSNVQLLELSEAETQRRFVEQSGALTMSTHYPQLSAIGSLGRSSYTRSDFLDSASNAWTVGLQLKIPIFTGLTSVYDRRQVASQLAQADIQTAKVRSDLALDQINASKSIELAKVVMDSSKAALDQAREAQKVARRTYKLGTSTYLQVSDAQKNFQQAELSYDQALYSYIQAMVRYFVSRGWSLDPLVDSLAVASAKPL